MSDNRLINIYINGSQYQVEPSISIKEAARRLGINIPTLCHHPGLKPIGKCKVCVVEVLNEGMKLSCCTEVKEGMNIITNSNEVKVKANQALLESLSKQSHYNTNDNILKTSLPSELEELMNISKSVLSIDDTSNAITKDDSLCVDCSRCIRACSELQGMNILAHNDSKPYVVTNNLNSISNTECISCGQCSLACPTNAITEHYNIDLVEKALNDTENKVVVLQTAPATRVAIGEMFGDEPGTINTAKLVSGSKQIGFKYVFDTCFGADLTIMEEAAECLERIKKGGPFPMFTSCCPAWVNMVEKCYPELIPHLSTCKSPHMMLAPMIKTYWASSLKIDPKKVFVVSMMPCTAKKDDVVREILFRDGKTDVDSVLTTRELGEIFKRRGIKSAKDFNNLPDAKYDSLLGVSSGAAVLFGVTGGVMEAAIRTLYELQTHQPLPKIEINPCRGLAGVKEAVIPFGGLNLKLAICSGGANIRSLLKKVLEKKVDYHFIECMACPSGCINGGGQPRSLDPDVVRKRMMGIYSIDRSGTLRKSHDNPEIQELYRDFLGKPLSRKSHELLHTHYVDRRGNVIAKETRDDMVEPSVSGGILILYGSQGGKTAKAASIIKEDLNAALAGKVNVQYNTLDSYNVNLLPQESQIIILCSTFGDGELPDNAKKFYKELDTLELDSLKDVNYCVCGLGSMEYKATFNKAARMLDEKMSSLGAQKIMETVECDDLAVGGYFETFNAWIKDVIKVMGGSTTKRSHPRPPRFVISVSLRQGTSDPSKRPPPPGYQLCPVKEVKTLSAPFYAREVRQFVIDITGSGLTYSTGDHIAILPRNDPNIVKDFLKIYGLAPETLITIFDNENKSPFPSMLTVNELFEQYIDFNAPLTSKFLEDFKLFCTDSSELGEFTSIEKIAEESKTRYNDYLKEETVLSIYRKFPKTLDNMSFAQFLSITPLISPRLYSIASSSTLFPSTVQIAIVLFKFQSPLNKVIRTGTCTNYLFNLLDISSNPYIACYTKPGLLKYPIDRISNPTILFGLGTGVGVMRAFIQERAAFKEHGLKLGSCDFWQACRHCDKDFVYSDETAEYVKKGVITKHHTAFSHDQEEFVTIPYVIDREPQEIWDIVKNGDCVLLYCGPAFGIPQSILASIERAIITVGNLPVDQTKILMEKIKNNFSIECYS